MVQFVEFFSTNWIIKFYQSNTWSQMGLHEANLFCLSDIMDLRHQSSSMCIIMLGGENTHPWSATKVGNTIPSHYSSRPVTKKQPTNYSNQPLCSRPVEFFCLSCFDIKVKKIRLYVINFFERISVAHSSYNTGRIADLKSVASKSCQLVDRRANDRPFYRDA